MLFILLRERNWTEEIMSKMVNDVVRKSTNPLPELLRYEAIIEPKKDHPNKKRKLETRTKKHGYEELKGSSFIEHLEHYQQQRCVWFKLILFNFILININQTSLFGHWWLASSMKCRDLLNCVELVSQVTESSCNHPRKPGQVTIKMLA